MGWPVLFTPHLLLRRAVPTRARELAQPRRPSPPSASTGARSSAGEAGCLQGGKVPDPSTTSPQRPWLPPPNIPRPSMSLAQPARRRQWPDRNKTTSSWPSLRGTDSNLPQQGLQESFRGAHCTATPTGPVEEVAHVALGVRPLVGESRVQGLLSAAREGSAQAPPRCPSGCSLHAKHFPHRRATRGNVSLRRKGFEFIGPRH